MTGNLALDYAEQYTRQRLYELQQLRKAAKFTEDENE